jgi:TetR/AcrR family transcriptional regulator, transcriptional repressor of bet genes
MPAPADRPARRAHLAQLAIKIIGTEGMNAATIRRLATEAGYSTAIVTHYFPNKRDLLFNTYEHVSETAIAHFESVAADPAGSIEQVMETFLPIGEEEENSWKVVFAFWQLALHDEDFAARQRVAMQRSQDLIEKLLVDRGYRGDALRTARQLLVTVMGISIRASFEPSWTDEVKRQCLRDALASVGLGA